MNDKDTAAEAAAEGTNAAEEDPLTVAKRQADENWSKYLRAVAEIDNLRKRSARELENARKFGAERLVSALLPVRDSLEAGLDAASAESHDLGAILEGERATLRLLIQALATAGVSEIDPEGEPFNPECHEAMSLVVSPSAEPNSVLTVIQKGYLLHDRVIRPARVIVAASSPPGGDEP